MTVVQEDDRFYVVRPNTQERMEVPPGLEECLKGEYVIDFQAEGTRITYSEGFYEELAKRLNEGMKPREAYESLGFPVKILGRDRANNACRKARKIEAGKVNPKTCTKTRSPEELLTEACGGNQYVKSIHGERIFYADSFWPAMNEQLEKGLSPLDAYEALGFSVDTLGTQRAYKAASHAREWMEKQEHPQFQLGDYDGTVPLADMIEKWGTPSFSTKWEAYLMARVIAMEKREEAIKKEVDVLGRPLSFVFHLKLNMTKIANDFIHSGEAQKLGLKNSQVLRMFGVNPNTYSSYCKRHIDQKAREEKEAEKAKK